MRYKGRDSASGIDEKLSIIRPGATAQHSPQPAAADGPATARGPSDWGRARNHAAGPTRIRPAECRRPGRGGAPRSGVRIRVAACRRGLGTGPERPARPAATAACVVPSGFSSARLGHPAATTVSLSRSTSVPDRSGSEVGPARPAATACVRVQGGLCTDTGGCLLCADGSCHDTVAAVRQDGNTGSPPSIHPLPPPSHSALGRPTPASE